MSDKSMLASISEKEARELLKQDDYCSDVQIVRLLGVRALEVAADAPVPLIGNGRDDAPSVKDGPVQYNVALAVLRERCPSFDISYSTQERSGVLSGSSPLYLRVRPKTVFHLGKALRTLLIGGLGLFLAWGTSASLSTLFALWFGLSLVEVAHMFIACYERIEEPKEQLVFETVWKLQNQYCIVNYSALEVGDFDRGYGHFTPTTETLCHELANRIDSKQIETVLYSLKRRDILDERQGRWSVRFW
jgi:hypothetical protein